MKVEKNNWGYTLIELLLTISIIAVLAGISVPVYQGLQLRNELDVAANSTVQSLRRAQVLSQAVDGNSTWGVKVNSGSNITIFKGSSYSVRDTSFDETFDLPTNITASGVTEIVYNKLSGLPISTGNLTFTSSANETKQISINSKGMVDY